MTYIPDGYEPPTPRYSTKQDAIEQGIIVSLGDESPEGYDIDAIFAEVFEYRLDKNERGDELLTTAGFEQVVDVDEFWQIVARHER